MSGSLFKLFAGSMPHFVATFQAGIDYNAFWALGLADAEVLAGGEECAAFLADAPLFLWGDGGLVLLGALAREACVALGFGPTFPGKG